MTAGHYTARDGRHLDEATRRIGRFHAPTPRQPAITPTRRQADCRRISPYTAPRACRLSCAPHVEMNFFHRWAKALDAEDGLAFQGVTL